MRGPNEIVFKDGQRIRFGFPSFRLGGTIYGERTIETIGSCTYEDVTNSRRAVLLVNTFKKTGWFKQVTEGSKDTVEGIIYDAKGIDDSKQSINKNFGRDIEFVNDFAQLTDVKKQICKISGSWLEKLDIDGRNYWNLERDIPNRQEILIND